MLASINIVKVYIVNVCEHVCLWACKSIYVCMCVCSCTYADACDVIAPGTSDVNLGCVDRSGLQRVLLQSVIHYAQESWKTPAPSEDENKPFT